VSNLQPIIIIVVGILVLGLVWKLIAGAIRLVLTLGVIAVVAYLVLNALR
jgi:hypothetical protein